MLLLSIHTYLYYWVLRGPPKQSTCNSIRPMAANLQFWRGSSAAEGQTNGRQCTYHASRMLPVDARPSPNTVLSPLYRPMTRQQLGGVSEG